jgi:hypothetical protein
MKNLLSGMLLLFLTATANAQSKADEEAVRKLPQAFCDAWAKHDGHENHGGRRRLRHCRDHLLARES